VGQEVAFFDRNCEFPAEFRLKATIFDGGEKIRARIALNLVLFFSKFNIFDENVWTKKFLTNF